MKRIIFLAIAFSFFSGGWLLSDSKQSLTVMKPLDPMLKVTGRITYGVRIISNTYMKLLCSTIRLTNDNVPYPGAEFKINDLSGKYQNGAYSIGCITSNNMSAWPYLDMAISYPSILPGKTKKITAYIVTGKAMEIISPSPSELNPIKSDTVIFSWQPYTTDICFFLYGDNNKKIFEKKGFTGNSIKVSSSVFSLQGTYIAMVWSDVKVPLKGYFSGDSELLFRRESFREYQVLVLNK